MKYKYSVVTFITNNYEPVRENIINKRQDVEYLLITDDKNLTSSTWNVIYEPLLDNTYMNGLAKALIIKYNAYKYVNSDVYVVMDHSLVLQEDLDFLADRMREGFDVMCVCHPLADKGLESEYVRWYAYRDMSLKWMNKFNEYKKLRDCANITLIETTFKMFVKNERTNQFNDRMLSLVFNNYQFSECDPNDQCYFSILLETEFADLGVCLLPNQFYLSHFVKRYNHGSNNLVEGHNIDTPQTVKFRGNELLLDVL